MSVGLASLFQVSLDELHAVRGSRQSEIMDVIKKDCPYLAGVDEALEDADFPPCIEAVLHIVNGDSLNKDLGILYAYAVQALCWYVGYTITIPSGFPKEEHFDAFLLPLGCPVKVSDLSNGAGSPLPIPEPDFPPGIGYWSPEEIEKAIPFFTRLPDADVPASFRVAVEKIRKWVKEAKEEKHILVGLCY